MQSVPTPIWAALGRGWRWIVGQGPWGRVVVIVVGLVVLGAAASWLSGPARSTGPVAVFHGHRFTDAQAERITFELEGKQIAARAHEGRVEVRREDLAEAQALLEKLGLRPSTLHDLASPALEGGSLFEPASVREQRMSRQRARLLEAVIRDLDPRLDPLVRFHRGAARGLGTSGPVKITVYLRVADDLAIGPDLVQRIQVVVRNLEPELAPEGGLYVCDSRGNPLVDPSAPALGEEMARQVRADQYRARIESQLDWIKDVDVRVTMVPTAVPAGPEARPPIRAVPEPVVAVNVPLEESAPVPSAEERGPSVVDQARVVVTVPNVYYVELARTVFGAGPASPSNLGALVERTEARARREVASVVPAEALAEIVVDRQIVPTAAPDPGAARLSAAPASSAPWLPAALGGAAAAGIVLVLGAGHWWSARRGPRVVEVSRRHVRSELAGQGPSERARELVRLDPAAAAGVLQRWVGQGGPRG